MIKGVFIRFIALFVAVLSASGPFQIAAASQQPISFDNFSRQVALQPVDAQDARYQLDGVALQALQRLIIKTSLSTTKTELLTFHSALSDIIELYRMQDAVYYGAAVDTRVSLAEVIQALSQHESVTLVQPDLLQLKSRHHAGDGAHQLPIDHIRLLGIPKLWEKSKGRGVKVAIIDDGFDLGHEDLKQTKVIFQYDMQNHSQDAAPKDKKRDRHGTMVAGLIFAAHNGEGANGIAPEAELIAIRDTQSLTSNLLLSFHLAKLAGADVINCSWTSRLLLEPVADVIRDLAQHGREGKGVAVVFSAGNGRSELAANSSEATLPDVISVGALDKRGERLRISNYGKHIKFYTYGMRLLTTTTAPEHPYWNFGGTSASAPLVSGIIALLLGADPGMTLPQLEQRLGDLLGGHA